MTDQDPDFDTPEHIESFATKVMVIALSISLSACVIAISHAVWPHLMAALEATQFAP